jgi:hypothetical protein
LIIELSEKIGVAGGITTLDQAVLVTEIESMSMLNRVAKDISLKMLTLVRIQ